MKMLNALDETIITEFYIIIISTLLFTLITSIWLLYLLNTDLFLKFGLSFYRSISGMRVKYLPRKNGKGIWCYAEKGVKSSHLPTLVFVHGFGGCKDDWPMILKRIPSAYHCIVVDLPGHGDTTFIHDYDKPNVEEFAETLKEFFDILNLNEKNQIFLIGCSFGGAVCTFYTHKYPDNVKLLALLCPAILTPILTDTCKEVLNGNYDVLIPKSGTDFISTINLLCFKNVYYPLKIMQAFVNINFSKRQNLLRKVLENLVTTDLAKFNTEYKCKLFSIKTRTLILWGRHDEMLHVSGAKYLNEALENSQMQIIDECGHVLQLDQPELTVNYLIEFLEENL